MQIISYLNHRVSR